MVLLLSVPGHYLSSGRLLRLGKCVVNADPATRPIVGYRGSFEQVRGRPMTITLNHTIVLARAHSGCEVWQQDFLKLDLPDNHFDGVFANAALFHVPSQELPRVLPELYASLKPGGVLFSSNPRGHNEEGWHRGCYGAYHDLG